MIHLRSLLSCFLKCSAGLEAPSVIDRKGYEVQKIEEIYVLEN